MKRSFNFLGWFGISKEFSRITVANGLSSVITGVFWIFLASIMSTEDYGKLGYFLSIALMFSSISLIGLNNTIMTLIPKGIERIKAEANFIVLISNLIILVPLLLFLNHIPIVLLLVALSFFSMSLAEELSRKNFKKYSYYTISQRTILVVASILLYFVIGIDGILLGYAISLGIFSFNFFRSFKNFDYKFTEIRKRFSLIMHVYSLTLTRKMSLYLDKLIIPELFGFSILGEYLLGFQILMLLAVIPSSTIQFLLPTKSSGNQEKNFEKKIIIISIIFSLITFLAIPIVIPILFPNFENVVDVARIMCLAVIPWTVTSIFHSRVIAIEKTKSIVISGIVRLASLLILLFILGESFGLIGLGLSVLISMLLQTISLSLFYKFFISSKKYDISK